MLIDKKIKFGSYIDPTLKKAVDVRCAQRGLSVIDALDEAFKSWLGVEVSRGAEDPEWELFKSTGDPDVVKEVLSLVKHHAKTHAQASKVIALKKAAK